MGKKDQERFEKTGEEDNMTVSVPNNKEAGKLGKVVAVPSRRPATSLPNPASSFPSPSSSRASVPAKPRINPALLRRSRSPVDDEPELEEPIAVSAGPIDKVIDLAFNPTRDKIREVTIIDRMQGRLFPQLDMMNCIAGYCMEISYLRQNKVDYKKMFHRDHPVSPNLTEEFLYRTAQWLKSVAGKNLERATDMALAQIETQGEEEQDALGNRDIWAEK